MSDERPASDGGAEAEPARAEPATEQGAQSARAPGTETATVIPDGDARKRRPGGRRVLAAVFWLLASVAVLVSGITLWAHQTLLTADGWGGLVADVVDDEEVTEAISVVVVDRLAESTGIGAAVAEAVPGPDIVGRAVSGVVQDRLTGAVAEFAASDGFQDAFVRVNKAAHRAAIAAIRGGDSEALTSEAGVISLNIFPLIEGVLYSLQDAGLLDASREIPDLTEYEASPRLIGLLERVLDRDIPDDVGTIVLLDSENLELVQNVVRWFDLITIVLLLAWAAFTALALWLSERRVRMVLWLSGGAIAALLTGRVLTRLLLEAVTRRQPELEARVVVSAIIDAAVDSLMWFTFVLILVALIVAVAAVIWEQRDGLRRRSMETPPRTLGRWVRDNVVLVLAAGLGLIVVMALWSIGGPGIALLTAAALLLLDSAVKVLSDQAEDQPAERPAPEG
jgi:hypothetical protein